MWDPKRKKKSKKERKEEEKLGFREMETTRRSKESQFSQIESISVESRNNQETDDAYLETIKGVNNQSFHKWILNMQNPETIRKYDGAYLQTIRSNLLKFHQLVLHHLWHQNKNFRRKLTTRYQLKLEINTNQALNRKINYLKPLGM